MKITHRRVLLLVKMQAEACNFTKSNTPPWGFFTFFKLYKWYQIVQSITNTIIQEVISNVAITEKNEKHMSRTTKYTRDPWGIFPDIDGFTDEPVHSVHPPHPLPPSQKKWP